MLSNSSKLSPVIDRLVFVLLLFNGWGCVGRCGHEGMVCGCSVSESAIHPARCGP